MKILAIETSCEIASVALCVDRAVLERTLTGHANHSEHLLDSLKELVIEAGFALGDLDALAFGAGPGAFTGLRLACGVAQGLAMGLELPVVPVSSLQALALQAPGERVFVVTDARMGEVYRATYIRRGEGAEIVDEPICCPPEQVEAPEGGAWYGVGSGFSAYANRLSPALTSSLIGVDGTAVPSAGDVARQAAIALREGGGIPAELAAPLYVRDKVALTTAERLARGGKA